MEVDELYQDIILDHYKNPRHAAKISDSSAMIDEENPTCGDHIKLNARLEGGRIAGIEVDCTGCAICTASASIMSEMMMGKSAADAVAFGRRFTGFLRGEGAMSDEELGDLVALRGVSQYPLRVKCATMGWHALEAAIRKLS